MTRKEAIKKYFARVRVKQVTDGDTFILENWDKVRLIGVNTPETMKYINKEFIFDPEPFGVEAKDEVIRLIEGKYVYLQCDQKGEHGNRKLRYVYLEDGSMLNEYLILIGMAKVMNINPNTMYASTFQLAEDIAKSEGRGIWGEEL